MEWVRNAQKFTIGPRFAHASCAVDKTIFIVGGQKKNYLDDLWAWDCAGDEWVGYSPAGRVPAPRVQSTAVFTGKELLLFGGYVENVAEENDLHALDVLNAEREYTWTQPEAVGAKPPKRYGHSATMVDGRMVVIAGQDSSAQLSDVWVLEAATYAWSRLEPGGDAFLPRALHSASHVPGHGLVVLGGFNRTARNLNQALVLELGADGTAAAWRECAGADALDMFKGRAQHRAVVQASHLIVFGGYNGSQPARRAARGRSGPLRGARPLTAPGLPDPPTGARRKQASARSTTSWSSTARRAPFWRRSSAARRPSRAAGTRSSWSARRSTACSATAPTQPWGPTSFRCTLARARRASSGSSARARTRARARTATAASRRPARAAGTRAWAASRACRVICPVCARRR